MIEDPFFFCGSLKIKSKQLLSGDRIFRTVQGLFT